MSTSKLSNCQRSHCRSKLNSKSTYCLANPSAKLPPTVQKISGSMSACALPYTNKSNRKQWNISPSSTCSIMSSLGSNMPRYNALLGTRQRLPIDGTHAERTHYPVEIGSQVLPMSYGYAKIITDSSKSWPQFYGYRDPISEDGNISEYRERVESQRRIYEAVRQLSGKYRDELFLPHRLLLKQPKL